MNKGSRAIIWLLIGVAKAIDVKNSFNEGIFIKKEGNFKGLEMIIPIDEPSNIA